MTDIENSLFSKDNLLAWCIVPYDSKERSPAERIAMLKELGFSQYAWDWRENHLAIMAEEIRVAQENGVRIRATWLWVDPNTDEVGKMNAGNRAVMDTVKEAGISVEFWLGFHENYFDGLSDEESVAQGAAMVAYLADEAAKSGSTIALYNHGGWFGESENQIAIIKAVDNPSVGMVYNFHHAHHEIDRFESNLQSMLPYLKAVSINGMNPGGPKIVPVGQGEKEAEMLRILQDSGYNGPISILGHVENVDVREILLENLKGLKAITAAPGGS